MSDRIITTSDGTRSIERDHPDEDADCTIRCSRCNAICETRAEEESELCADCQWDVIQEENQ